MLRGILATVAATLVPAALAASDQQIAYGKYLSGECVACHKEQGARDGIPPIAGRDSEELVRLIRAYKTGERTHEAMVSVARSLDEEQIKALAAYFATLQPPAR